MFASVAGGWLFQVLDPPESDFWCVSHSSCKFSLVFNEEFRKMHSKCCNIEHVLNLSKSTTGYMNLCVYV